MEYETLSTLYSNSTWILSTLIGGLAYTLVDERFRITKKLFGNLDSFLDAPERRPSDKSSKLETTQ